MAHTYVARGKHFEEFSQGDIAVSAGRTITEADIVNFAGLAGDYTQIHTNAEFARHGFFGQRVAHGVLLMAIATGLLAQLGFIEGTVLAFREITWKFRLPVFIGDTIHVQAAVANLKPMKRLGGGAVTFDVQVINQGGEVVQSGQWILLIASQSELSRLLGTQSNTAWTRSLAKGAAAMAVGLCAFSGNLRGLKCLRKGDLISSRPPASNANR